VAMWMYRMLLNVMYTMVETMRWPNDNDSDEWKRLRESFRAELSMLLLFTVALLICFRNVFLHYMYFLPWVLCSTD